MTALPASCQVTQSPPPPQELLWAPGRGEQPPAYLPTTPSPRASSRQAPVGACPCLRGCCGCFTVNQAGFSFCCSEQVKGETC